MQAIFAEVEIQISTPDNQVIHPVIKGILQSGSRSSSNISQMHDP